MGAEFRRALIVRIGALGDVLLTRRLTYSLSLAGFRSTILAPRRHAALLLADPWIDEVLDAESPALASTFEGSWPRAHAGFEASVVLSNSAGLRKAAAAASSISLALDPAPRRDDTPMARQWADAAHPVCAAFTGTLPLLGTTSRGASAARATLIHPGSGSPGKNWPVERFVELSRSLKAAGHRVTWVLGPAESGLRETAAGEVIDRPSLQTLAATLGQSGLYIGNDSGVSHLAAAVGTPVVVLFGPTSAGVWRPDGPRVRVVPSRSGRLVDIPVEAVIAAADDVTRLSETGRG